MTSIWTDVRGTYAAAALTFVAFAVWGSLFPFEVRPRPLSDTLTLFFAAWDTGPVGWSRSDFVSNVLLFVPIGLFGAASLDAAWGRARALTALGVIAAACLLSVAVELTQASILWRTSSVVDVLAETAGTAIGLLTWCATAARIDELVLAAQAVVRRASPFERALLAYAMLFAIAWLVPFDFTLRPIEIADKYAHKRLLLPFMASPDALSPPALLTIAIAAIPLGMAAVRVLPRARRPITDAMRICIPVLLALEIAQALVFSRTTDTRGMVAAMLGAIAGTAWTTMARNGTAAPLPSGPAR